MCGKVTNPIITLSICPKRKIYFQMSCGIEIYHTVRCWYQYETKRSENANQAHFILLIKVQALLKMILDI